MDLIAILEKFGFVVAAAVFLGWWLKASLTDRIKALESANSNALSKLDELNKYIREEQADMIAEAHVRERELVDLIRRQNGDPRPDPQPTTDLVRPKTDANDTARIMEAVREKHGKTPREGSRILKGISGHP